jgi:hypothetical protein
MIALMSQRKGASSLNPWTGHGALGRAFTWCLAGSVTAAAVRDALVGRGSEAPEAELAAMMAVVGAELDGQVRQARPHVTLVRCRACVPVAVLCNIATRYRSLQSIVAAYLR